MKKIFYFLFISFSLFFLPALGDDSIPSTILQELVVKSERSWIEKGIFNFIPSKKEKQLSNSPGSLIDVMNIPILKGNGDQISTVNDEPVVIFINGELANETDLATFWPKEVKKVEFIMSPSDAKYLGARNVVNFIVTKYQAGGVTRANIRQNIPHEGRYDLASKLTYNKMTFGTKLVYGYWKQNNNILSEDVTYKNIFFNGIKYDEIIQNEISEKDSEKHDITFVGNAKYVSQKFNCTHTFQLSWNKTPGDRETSSNKWSQDLFDSDYSGHFSKMKSLSPIIGGDYYGILSDKWVLSGLWRYGFATNHNFTWDQTGEYPKIENGVDEKINATSLAINLWYKPTPYWTIILSANPKFKWYSSVYNGSTNDHVSQLREDIASYVSIYWMPSSTINLMVKPGILYSSYKVGEIINKKTLPTLDANFYWNPNNKLYWGAAFRFEMSPLSMSAANPVLIKGSDLTWIEGNPYLNPRSEWFLNSTATYLVTNNFSITGNLWYIKSINSSYNSYEVAPADMGGVIIKTINAPTSDEVRAFVDFRLSLLNYKLSLRATPAFTHKIIKGTYACNFNNWGVTAEASYVIGNFRINASYRSRNKFMGDAGQYLTRQNDRFQIGVSYGWKNLYANFTIYNLFHDKQKSYTVRYSDVVPNSSYFESVGRSFCLNLTYTFDYGKKVDRNISIDTMQAPESSILSN